MSVLNLQLPPPSTTISIAVLLFSLYSYRAAWTPPQAKASDSITVGSKNRRLIPMYNRELAALARTFVSVHFITECFVLYSSGTNQMNPTIQSICSNEALSKVYLSNQLSPSTFLPLCVILLGAFIRTSAHRALGKMYTWETSLLKSHKLVTGGPYNYVRHPGYTGLITVCVGYLGFLCSPGTVARECIYGEVLEKGLGSLQTMESKSLFGLVYAVALVILFVDTNVFLVRRSYEEDALMKKEFGKEWDEWSRRVPARVIPFVL